MHATRVLLCVLGAWSITSGVSADVIDDFDNSTNLGTWLLTTNPNFPPMFVQSGGNPGAYLEQHVSTAVPTWHINNPANNPFVGDYAGESVTGFSFDMIITGGIEVPDRNMTLHLSTTLGTGDLSQGIEAWYVGTDISNFPTGWTHFSYDVDAASSTIPTGWVVFEGNGDAGTDADWHALMTHIEDVGIALGTPGFAYPNLGVWDLSLDNVQLSMAPAPGAGIMLALGALAYPGRRRTMMP
ncbi:MAG TPA: hypothetical protein VG711_07365 [Phycisphaerales bacterium]|nr:hypothetical protein [Phycisphaerales bacterium]